jgi:hypothetical protein
MLSILVLEAGENLQFKNCNLTYQKVGIPIIAFSYNLVP